VPAADPGHHTHHERLRRLLLLTALGGLLAFVVLAAAVGAHAGGGLDGRVIAWADAHEREPLTALAVALDHGWRWWVAAGIVAVVCAALWRARRRAEARYLALVVAASLLLNLLLKIAFQRDPPGGSTVVRASHYAFPSGHTMSAAAFATALAFIAWPTRYRWPVLAGAAAFALAMGLSRVYLGVHWPSDVAAGWAMGLVVAVAVRAVVWHPPGAARPGTPAMGGGPVDALGARPGDAPGIHVVFLDWGDTLMVDDGAGDCPMKDWPRVAAVTGARDALHALHGRFRLVVATNADASTGADVLAALARVGLDGLVDGVVSSADVGHRKPDAAFYRAALQHQGTGGAALDPARAVMVGDSAMNDVAGAKAAGLRAVWLNPARLPLPPGAPTPDAEIGGMSELPRVVERLCGARAPGSPG
jgi:HAD superfamily hydrolase (TIGR01509 family)